jgi:hypothetical protein
MDELLAQGEYGVFNPRFLGISLLFESPENYRTHLQYMMEDEPPPMASSDLNRIAVISSLDHEVRHYHDFLLSPYSYQLFRLRLQALANGGQALSSIARELDGNCLPVPLSRWLTLTGSERQRQVMEWRTGLDSDITPVKLPVIDADELLRNKDPGQFSIAHLPAEQQFALYVEIAARAYARIEQLTAGFGASDHAPYLSPRNVHEASALTSQIAAVFVGQGLEQSLRLIDFLLDSQLGHALTWQKFLQVALLLEEQMSPRDDPESLLRAVQRIQTITTWCLLGNYQLDGEQACPAVRFQLLAAGLVSDPENRKWSSIVTDKDDLKRMWDYWDKRSRVSPWQKSLETLLDFSRRGVRQYQNFRRTFAGGPHIPDLAVAMIEDVSAQQHSIVDAFLADPVALADPWHYVRVPSDLLPAPLIRLELVGYAIDVPSVGQARVVTRTEVGGKEYAASIAFPLSLDPASWDRLDRALQFEELSEWCDVAFARLSVPDHVIRSARRGIQEISQKRVLQLI